jgi:hypothetical protein
MAPTEPAATGPLENDVELDTDDAKTDAVNPLSEVAFDATARPSDMATDSVSSSAATMWIGSSSKIIKMVGEFKPQDVGIRVYNKSSTAQPFILYPSAPKFGPGDQPGEIFTCVYATSRKIAPDSGSANFVIAATEFFNQATKPSQLQPIYAVTGLAYSPLAPNVGMEATDHILLNEQRSSCKMGMPADSDPCFDRNYQAVPNQEQFQIKVDNSFTYPDEQCPFVGLGVMSRLRKTSPIICVMVWEAVPGSTYNFRTSDSWNCSRGTKEPGTAIDLKDWLATVEFKVVKSGKHMEIAYAPDGSMTMA